MSDQESSSPPPPKARKKVKRTEETIIRNVLKSLRELKNEHKTPFILSLPSKYGQLHFGSTYAVAKMKADFEDEAEWKDAFVEDQDELIEGLQLDVEEDDVDEYNYARGTMIAQKLPADLPLMIYVELWSWITQEIMKEHWLKDGKKKCVKWGDSSFEPSFWLGDVWPWHQVRKHYKDLPKSSYTGPGIMTDFLKRVVENRLSMLGIDHENWVSAAFTDEQRLHRQKHQIKKKAVPSTIEMDDEEEEGMDGLSNMDDNMEDMDDNMADNDDTNSNVSNSEIPCTASTSDSMDRTLPRRRASVRQAEKRARGEYRASSNSFPPRPPVPPPTLSPIQSTSPPARPRTSSPPANRQAQAPFVPRRNPLPKATAGCGNFRSRLNVNFGQRDRRRMEMHLPTDLVRKFGELSKANTADRKETGGIIAGEKKNGYYQITHLIIPEQTGSSVTWEVHDERQLTNFFVYKPSLVMLGIIHTHPNMTSFLSSVDLHAIYDYARDNPKLISIVLAPELNTSPAFCLTKYGISELSKCDEIGFHHHRQDESKYYQEADYVVYDEGFSTEVIDFRLHV